MQEKQDIVGYIYGNVGSTEFNFAVNDPNLRKFDYIYAPHKEGHMLAQVMDIRQHSDLHFEDATSMMNSRGEVKSINASLSAFATVIGYRDREGLLQSPRTPFSAGTAILKANEELIRHVLGLDASKENGAYVGLLKGHNIKVYLNIDTLVQKHICILAKTGGGKSYVCGVLIEELLKHKVPTVIIDTHGEYHSLIEPNKSRKDKQNMEKFDVKPKGYVDRINEYSPIGSRGNIKHLTLNGTNLEAREIIELLSSKLSGPQIGVLYQAIKELKEYKTIYNIKDIIEAVTCSKSNARWNVIASLESLDSIGVFSEKSTDVRELVKEGICTTINMKGVPPDVQDVVVARLTKELFDTRKLGKIPPFLYIVEEAHNYCPERGYGNAVSSNILRTVASEGRKFGMGLCIVSQRPAKVDKNIISQCNTNIILKVTNPNDLKAIINSVEGLTNQTYDEIQRLPVGVAFVSGAGLQVPIMVEIRTRETNHGGKSVEITGLEEELIKPKIQKIPAPPPLVQKSNPALAKQQIKIAVDRKDLTEKAKIVARVANRLGWANNEDPNEVIKILKREAEKMNENVYKFLEMLAKLGNNFCHAEIPLCIKCPMNNSCKYRLKSTTEKRGIFR